MWRVVMVFAVLVTMTFFGTSAGAVDDKVIGSVKTLKGEGVVVREGVTLVPEPGTRLYQWDVVRTGKDGAMGIILRDETALSIGPSSELSLKEFVFRPKEGVFASVVRFVRGTLVYITGRITKLSPDAAKVETPVGFAAVRGSKFLIKIGE